MAYFTFGCTLRTVLDYNSSTPNSIITAATVNAAFYFGTIAPTPTIYNGGSILTLWSAVSTDTNFTLAVDSGTGNPAVTTCNSTGLLAYNSNSPFDVLGTIAGVQYYVYVLLWDANYVNPAAAAINSAYVGTSNIFLYTPTSTPTSPPFTGIIKTFNLSLNKGTLGLTGYLYYPVAMTPTYTGIPTGYGLQLKTDGLGNPVFREGVGIFGGGGGGSVTTVWPTGGNGAFFCGNYSFTPRVVSGYAAYMTGSTPYGFGAAGLTSLATTFVQTNSGAGNGVVRVKIITPSGLLRIGGYTINSVHWPYDVNDDCGDAKYHPYANGTPFTVTADTVGGYTVAVIGGSGTVSGGQNYDCTVTYTTAVAATGSPLMSND